jgi:Ca2+-binding EF-hand superfamily protein
MSTKKKVLAVAAVLAVTGTIAAVSAPGPRGGMGHDGQHGWQHAQDGHDGMGRRGWFNREVSKEAFDTRMRERFAGLDKNSDGFIDAAEIEAAGEGRRARMMERFRGGRGGDGAGQADPGMRLVQRFDGNRDGKASKDEFLARVRKQFAEFDLNSDGKISDDDLPPMMRGQGAIQRMARGEGAHGGRGGHGGMGGGMRFLNDVEVKDGAVTLDAAVAAATRMFDRFDRNKDGAIDKADVDAMRKDMTDYRVKRFIHANGADKDGKVSREQFFAKSAERFAEMDANGDGKIGRGEMHGHGRHGGHHGMGGPDRGDGMQGPMGGPGMGGPGGEGRPGMAPKQ